VVTDPNSEGLQKTLHKILKQLQSRSLATTSAAKYSGTWRQWCQWCDWLGFSQWLPEKPQEHSYQLALFATYCWSYGWKQSSSGNSAGTVLSKISQVSWHHRRTLGYTLGLLPGHQLAITGMRRSDPPSHPKSPITVALLRHMHKLLNFSEAQDRVIWGASVLGFFFLLRRSEYLALGAKVQPYAIHRADVTFVGHDGNEAKKLELVLAVIVRFRGSKTDQFGEGASRRLERSGFRWCCPVRAAWYLVEHHKSLGVAESTLLCRIDATRNLQVRQVVDVIKGAAKQAGQEPERFGSHSLRSGGASALFNAGFDSLAVKLFGRWKSDAVERYTRIGGRLTAKMAHEMMAKPAILQNGGVSATPLPGSGSA
jgi:hypothetical protein